MTGAKSRKAMTSLSRTWGTESHERLLDYPCDRFVKRFDDVYYRGVTIKARAEIIFRWLCQMRMAPYSYDWIDNSGRKSPQNWTPQAGALAVGQDVMKIFELIHFERNKAFTIRINRNTVSYRIFGDVAISYIIVPASAREYRLLVKFVCRYPKGLSGKLMRRILPWGDLIMIRRQLLNFKRLSEKMQKNIPREGNVK